MIDAFGKNYYLSICKQWTHTITTLSESQTHIWSPLSCSFTILNRFAHDTSLQQELFGKLNFKLIFIDGYEAVNPLWEEFEKQFFHFLPDAPIVRDLDTYLSSHADTSFGIFLVGFDTAIKHEHTELLKHIGSLLEKYPQVSLVLLTEQNIADSPVYTDLIKKHMVIENINYQPLMNTQDTQEFVENLSHAWDFALPEDYKQIIVHDLGGHPLLLEEAVRIIREHPTITSDDLLASPTLIRKARMIFKSLSENDQEIIRSVAHNQPTEISEYLNGTGLITNTQIGLPYWNYLYTKLPDTHIFADQHPNHLPIEFEHHLTSVERSVFDMLVSKQGTLISREDVAKSLWKDMWEDKYSDWAIDQTIHRIREKLAKYQNMYEVKTKKGEGFLMLTR